MHAKATAVLEPRQLNDADRDILDVLQEGRATPGYLSQETGHDSSYINQRLRRLEEHDHVRTLARGLWELVDDPRDSTE
jgi:predicted HTH transcriptional regulator